MKSTATLVAIAAALAFAPAAQAHPEACNGSKTTAFAAFDFTSASHFGPNDDEGEFCFSKAQVERFDDSKAANRRASDTGTKNVKHLANLLKSGPFAGEPNYGSDLAFWGNYAIQGNYNGFQITDISSPENPRIVSQVNCPGAQNDVSVWKNYIITSTDQRRSDDSCNSFPLTTSSTPASNDPNAEYWEGIKVFDWSDPAAPKLVTSVETDCGSHTNTIIPQADRILVYVSSYDLNVNAKDCRLTSTPTDDHDKISIVEVPLGDPAASKVIAEPVLFPDGGYDGSNGYTRRTAGCHDITVYPAIGKAAGACMGEGLIMDIKDPVNPKVLSTMFDPNFAFWHSATFFEDGSKVLFTDELGGGGQATCNPSVDQKKGANAIYDVSTVTSPTFLSYYKIPRVQTNRENCVAHNGVFIPTDKATTYVQAWYQGGTSFVDLDDPKNPREIGFFDRGPVDETRLVLGGSWSSYYYNGFVYSNDIQKGLDVLKFSDPRGAGAGANKVPYLNAQTQEPARKFRSASAKKSSKKASKKRAVKRTGSKRRAAARS